LENIFHYKTLVWLILPFFYFCWFRDGHVKLIDTVWHDHLMNSAVDITQNKIRKVNNNEEIFGCCLCTVFEKWCKVCSTGVNLPVALGCVKVHVKMPRFLRSIVNEYWDENPDSSPMASWQFRLHCHGYSFLKNRQLL